MQALAPKITLQLVAANRPCAPRRRTLLAPGLPLCAGRGGRRALRCLAAGFGWLLVACSAAAAADPGPGDALSSRDIYDRAIRNLMDAATLELELVSTAPGGHEQRFEVEMMWQRYRQGSPEAEAGILSRSLARYLEPFDLRETGALVIDHREGRDEQFLYVASSRRIKRLNLRGQNVFGTDFAVEDLVPPRILDAEYRRLPDGEVDGVGSYVIEVRFEGLPEERYSRGQFYVEKEDFVPLRVRYWDRAGVEDKRIEIDRERVREIEGLHIPTALTVVSLRSGSRTYARIARLVVNPPLTADDFSLRHLEQHSVGGIPDRFYQGAHVFEGD